MLVCGLLGCIGSGLPDGPSGALESGTYELVGVDGASVPVDHGPLPPRFGKAGPCHSITEQGALSLDDRGRRYMLHLIQRSSCGGHILSNRWTSGTYSVSGGLLRFHFSRGGSFQGLIDEDTIEVENSRRYVYARRPEGEPPIRSLSGSYRLTTVGGTTLPVDAGMPGATPTCTAQITEGFLSVGSDQGGSDQGTTMEFSFEYSVRDACTSELLHEVVERGTVERVQRTLAFTAELEVNIVRLFPGLIRGEDLVLFREQDYTFQR